MNSEFWASCEGRGALIANVSDHVSMRLSISPQSPVLRLIIGGAVVLIPILDIVYALVPNTEIGRDAYDALAYIFGISLVTFLVCGALHISERVFRSVKHWKSARHEPWEPFLLGDECVVIFAGWIEPPFFVCFYFLLCAALVPILALVVYLLSFGKFGFVPSFNGIP